MALPDDVFIVNTSLMQKSTRFSIGALIINFTKVIVLGVTGRNNMGLYGNAMMV